MSWYWWLLVCWAAFTVGFLLGAQWIMASSRWHYHDRGLRTQPHDREHHRGHHEQGPEHGPSRA